MSPEQLLDELLEEVLHDLDEIDVPYGYIEEISLSRGRSTLGDCEKLAWYDIPRYKIRVSKYLFEDDHPMYRRIIRNTICHEVVHTIKGCYNHSPEFKRWAKIINDAYPIKYSIQTHVPTGQSAFLDAHAANKEVNRDKYKITCNDCGHKYFFKTKTQVVKDVEDDLNMFVQCGKCGGHHFTLEYL